MPCFANLILDLIDRHCCLPGIIKHGWHVLIEKMDADGKNATKSEGMAFVLLYVTSSLSMTYHQVVSTRRNHFAFSANQGTPSSNICSSSCSPPDVSKTAAFTCQRRRPSPLLVSPTGVGTGVWTGALWGACISRKYSMLQHLR